MPPQILDNIKIDIAGISGIDAMNSLRNVGCCGIGRVGRLGIDGTLNGSEANRPGGGCLLSVGVLAAI